MRMSTGTCFGVNACVGSVYKGVCMGSKVNAYMKSIHEWVCITVKCLCKFQKCTRVNNYS